MPKPKLKIDHPNTPVRLEALSDGVFSIALTILIIDVVSVGKGVSVGETLSTHLLSEWRTLIAYMVGFITILVCWVNHHQVFRFIKRTNSGLFWINGLQLSLVSAVPLPTALLAANLTGPESRTAFIIYGFTYFLMALSFYSLWSFIDRHGLSDPTIDPDRYVGMGRIYLFAIAWTALCLVCVTFSPLLAIIMWTLMFVVFAFPAEFSHVLQTGHF